MYEMLMSEFELKYYLFLSINNSFIENRKYQREIKLK